MSGERSDGWQVFDYPAILRPGTESGQTPGVSSTGRQAYMRGNKSIDIRGQSSEASQKDGRLLVDSADAASPLPPAAAPPSSCLQLDSGGRVDSSPASAHNLPS